jgi:hypothetical protein
VYTAQQSTAVSTQRSPGLKERDRSDSGAPRLTIVATPRRERRIPVP